jgi:SpoU rRNA methylase family enzyme
VAISRLAVSNPGATTDTLIYTRTGSRDALASIIATNKSATAATIRVWVIPSGQDAVPANHATIAYNSAVSGNDSLETFRFPVTPNDKVYVRASTADISFTLSGIDNTNVSGTEYQTVLDIANTALTYSLVNL